MFLHAINLVKNHCAIGTLWVFKGNLGSFCENNLLAK